MPWWRKMAANSPEHQFPFQLFIPNFFFSVISTNQLTFLPMSRSLVLVLLLRAGVHPNPGPPDLISCKTILQFNCNGIQNSKDEIQDFLNKHQIKVAALQETKLTSKSRIPSFQDYVLVRRDRPAGRGGGLAFLVHHSVRYTIIDTSNLTLQSDQIIELQGISAYINESFMKIFNIYIPPVSANTQYVPDITKILDTDDDVLILGDFNAHHVAWKSNLSDVRGEQIAQQVEDSDLFLLNLDSQTRRPSNGTDSSPDISLISAHLAFSVAWETCMALNSDHLPICITFVDDQPPPRTNRSFMNLKRAKWGLLSSELEALLEDEPMPSNCSSGVNKFNYLFKTAAKHNIPAGYRTDFKPGLSRAAVDLVNERDQVRERDPQDPEVGRLNHLIDETISSDSRARWQEAVTSSKPNDNPDKFWRLMRILSGKRPHQPPNQPIHFGTKCYSKPAAIANKFCSQFSSASVHKTSQQSRRVLKNLKRSHPLDQGFKPFTPALTKAAIEMSSNSSAVGPDGLSALHLKCLGTRGIAYLTELFNISVARADIPVVWKTANIIPIPKPGKSPDQSTGYRPISLLSPCVKVLERLLLPYLTESLPSAPTQHGYKTKHSTVTACLPIVTNVAIGFNKDKPSSRTVMVALDISKAFDAVNHDLLLEKIAGTQLHSNIVRWLATYLRDRRAVCLFQGAVSRVCKCHSGVPQGSVISPVLFNFFVHDFPAYAEVNESYADDFNLSESGPCVDTLGRNLTEHLKYVTAWAMKNGLEISPSKSTVTLFTPDRHESNLHPQVFIEGTQLPLAKVVRFLGLNLSTHFVSSTQAKSANNKSSSRIQLLKATSGQDWGDKETLRLTYNAFLKPVMIFGAPLWYPNLDPESESIKSLQRVQNAGMRVMTGSHKAASTDHLLAETEMLPVADHLGMICSQFLASASCVSHPSHETVSRSTGSRRGRKKIVHTLQSKFGHVVEPFTTDGVLSPIMLKRTLKSIHTSVVTRNKQKLYNKVLSCAPPDIDPSEKTLCRRSRMSLSQLRSGECIDLKSYQKKIGTSPDDICPACRGAPHTTSHLFCCPSAPTDLSVRDLWKRPREANTFLGTLPSFDHLPPSPPLPPPPPEPPPIALRAPN